MAVFAPLSDSLPGTAREARAIARLFPGTELRLGRAATEPGVRQALEAGVPVHLASHGSQNSQNPLFSRMIVGRGGQLESRQDGRLEVHEILGLRTTSPLVFLSGCETALLGSGQEPFGRGMDEGSLAQALLVAGAGTVVWLPSGRWAMRPRPISPSGSIATSGPGSPPPTAWPSSRL